MGQYELYSFQPVAQWMDYSFPDLGAEGCCRSLNALLTMFPSSYHHEIFRSYYCQWQKWLPVFHMMMKRCRAWCWLGEVPYCFSRSSLKFQGHAAEKIIDFDPNWDFRTVTLVWIHWWVWNDAQSLKQHRRDALTFFKVVCQTSRSHGTKKSPILTWIERFRTVTPVWIHPWLSNDAQSLM